MTTIGGHDGKLPVSIGQWHSASSTHKHTSTHVAGTLSALKSIQTNSMHTCSVRSLQLTHSETSTLWDNAWFSSSMKEPVSQAECVKFLNVLGGHCPPLCYPSTLRSLLLRGKRQASKPSTITYILALPALLTDVCMVDLHVVMS